VKGLRWIGGVAVSYRKDDDGKDAVSALVVLDYPSMEVVSRLNHAGRADMSDQLRHTVLRQARVTNPYVPEYLAMRELFSVCEVYDQAILELPIDERPLVGFVDGHERWHERHAGLATAFEWRGIYLQYI